MMYKLYGKPAEKGFGEEWELLFEEKECYHINAELSWYLQENELDNYWSEFRIVYEREIK